MDKDAKDKINSKPEIKPKPPLKRINFHISQYQNLSSLKEV